MSRTITIILGLIILLGGGYLVWAAISSTQDIVTNGTGTTTPNGGQADDTSDGSATSTPDGAVPTVSTIEIALLDTEGTTSGEQRGCDQVVRVSRSIDPTTMPLTAALEELFGIEQEQLDGLTNFIARTNDTLNFDRAAVVDGTARIFLTGELSGLRGVCDNPRTAIQIEETAEQFPTVEDVQIFLNGEPTDLIPSER